MLFISPMFYVFLAAYSYLGVALIGLCSDSNLWLYCLSCSMACHVGSVLAISVLILYLVPWPVLWGLVLFSLLYRQVVPGFPISGIFLSAVMGCLMTTHYCILQL